MFNPTQSDIDGAYAVKIFLDHYPGHKRSIPLLARLVKVPEHQLTDAFHFVFNEKLDHYWAKKQWKELV